MRRGFTALMISAVAFPASTAFVAHAVQDTERSSGLTGSESVRGQLMAENHRSTVASFAESLFYLAKKEGPASAAGAQMRRIAQAQIDSMPAATEAIEETATRGTLARAFLGTDAKNLEVLRAEVVSTQQHLAELKAFLAGTTNATERAILTAQIRTLEEDQAHIQDFVAVNEKAYGLFGRFTRPASTE